MGLDKVSLLDLRHSLLEDHQCDDAKKNDDDDAKKNGDDARKNRCINTQMKVKVSERTGRLFGAGMEELKTHLFGDNEYVPLSQEKQKGFEDIVGPLEKSCSYEPGPADLEVGEFSKQLW